METLPNPVDRLCFVRKEVKNVDTLEFVQRLSEELTILMAGVRAATEHKGLAELPPDITQCLQILGILIAGSPPGMGLILNSPLLSLSQLVGRLRETLGDEINSRSLSAVPTSSKQSSDINVEGFEIDKFSTESSPSSSKQSSNIIDPMPDQLALARAKRERSKMAPTTRGNPDEPRFA